MTKLTENQQKAVHLNRQLNQLFNEMLSNKVFPKRKPKIKKGTKEIKK